MERGDPFTSDDVMETNSQSDVEEDSDSSSDDDDYSPGLLVIDTGGRCSYHGRLLDSANFHLIHVAGGNWYMYMYKPSLTLHV